MTSIRHRISIDVETTYLDDQSEPREQRYVFAYTITIRNEGEVPAKLLTRHWIITDANGRVQEVRGDGVVGEQPYLKPGQGFRYSIGAGLAPPAARSSARRFRRFVSPCPACCIERAARDLSGDGALGDRRRTGLLRRT